MQLHPLHCEELQANGRNIKTGPAFMPSPSEGLLTESCAGLQDCRTAVLQEHQFTSLDCLAATDSPCCDSPAHGGSHTDNL